MLMLGIVLLVVGWLLGIWILWVLGIVALVAALVLVLFSALGHPAGGRRY